MRISVNGTTLFVDIQGSSLVPDGATMREKPTVILLHGGPGHDHTLFRPDYDHLADIAQLVYVDQRGNGRSQGSDRDTWNLDQWADDVRALCDVLGIEKPIVLGWSFGGIVAMHYASRHPDHPAKLILQSTFARNDHDRMVEGFRTEGGEEAAAAMRNLLETGSPDAFGGFVEHCAPAYSPGAFPDAEGELAMARVAMNLDLTLSFLSGADFDLRPGLAALRCPTLVTVGTRDPITPLEASKEIMASLPSELEARLEVFERSGHFISGTEGDRFFSLLRHFIEE